MDLAWIKQNKWAVVVFGAATAGFVLYSYLHKSSSSSSSSSSNAPVGNPQYLVPVVQSAVAPNPTATVPSSNTPAPNLPPILSTPTVGAAATTVPVAPAPNFTSPVPTALVPNFQSQGYNVQTGTVQSYAPSGGGTTNGGLVLGPAAAAGYDASNVGTSPYTIEGGMLVTRDASGF